MPKVSVIIPVYGVEKYIERCARSLFEQTLDDIEFIFVDDCTPDRSIEILNRVLDEYPQRKNQVKILRHDKNHGLPITRQTGLKVVSGEYIAHCDSDDWVDVTMYEKMYNKAIEEGSDVVVCDYNIVSPNSTRFSPCQYCIDKKLYIEKMLRFEISWAIWNKLMRKSLYDGITDYPKDAMGEDMALVVPLAIIAEKISYVNEALYNYAINAGSIVQSVDIESLIRKSRQQINNVTLLEQNLKNVSDFDFQLLDVVKFGMKHSASVLLKIRGYGKVWRNMFSEINGRVLINRHIPLKSRIAYCIRYIYSYTR